MTEDVIWARIWVDSRSDWMKFFESGPIEWINWPTTDRPYWPEDDETDDETIV